MLYAHGNNEDLGSIYPLMNEMKLLYFGIDVLAVEYPGYGVAPGRPSEFTCNSLMNKAVDFLQKTYGCENIILVGRSIGSGPICHAAKLLKYRQKALIIWSGFASIRQMAVDTVGHGAACVIRNIWPNTARLKENKGPVLIVHGGMDEVISVAHPLMLLTESSASTTVLHVIENGGHSTHQDVALRYIDEFLHDLDIKHTS